MGSFRERMYQETLRGLRLCLEEVPDPEDRVAQDIAPGLVVSARVCSPCDHLAAQDAWLDHLSPEEIREIATLNTAVELAVTDYHLELVGQSCWELSSESHATNVLITTLDEFVPTIDAQPLNLRRGVLVAVPDAHRIAFGALEGEGSFLRNCALLLTRFRLGQERSIYLVDESSINRVAYQAAGGLVRVRVPGWVRRCVEDGEL